MRICDLVIHVIQVLVFESNPWGFTKPKKTTQRLRLHQAQWSSGEEHLHLSIICSLGSMIQHWSKQKYLIFPELPRLPTYLLAAIPALRWIETSPVVWHHPFSGFENFSTSWEASDPRCKCLIEISMISPTFFKSLNVLQRSEFIV